jgi:hypothetical protein
MWFLESVTKGNHINPQNCIVVDLFSESYSSAPSRTQRRKKRIEDACFEISDRWDTLAYRLGRRDRFGDAA